MSHTWWLESACSVAFHKEKQDQVPRAHLPLEAASLCARGAWHWVQGETGSCVSLPLARLCGHLVLGPITHFPSLLRLLQVPETLSATLPSDVLASPLATSRSAWTPVSLTGRVIGYPPRRCLCVCLFCGAFSRLKWWRFCKTEQHGWGHSYESIFFRKEPEKWGYGLYMRKKMWLHNLYYGNRPEQNNLKLESILKMLFFPKKEIVSPQESISN